jgi:hypothetical protein
MAIDQTETLRKACNLILAVTTDVVMENARATYTGDLEPWEVYEARKREKMRQTTSLLEKRVVAGYEALTNMMGEE